MKEIELIMPKMGESIAEATITRWIKKEGETIKADEAIVEIATDKVDSEVPSTHEGVLLKRLHNEGDVVAVGAPIAILGIESAAGAVSNNIPVVSSSNEESASPVKIVEDTISRAVEMTSSVNNGDRFYSPLVLNIARTEGISMDELERIGGTGKENRVTKKDIIQYVEDRKTGNVTQPSKLDSVPAAPQPVVAETKPSIPSTINISAPKVTLMQGDEIMEMDRMRKLIAEHMVMSKHVSPHVTSFVEADVTNMVLWREKIKSSFEKREGEKITFTPILMEAIVKAIKDFPMINIAVDGDKIIKRKSINIGMAAALPSGNLIVPVIKNADSLNLVGITKAVNDLAKRARENKLSPDDIQGGTYTLTNVGTFGNVMGTPVINQPQVAIMAAGAIRKKPAVIETEFGDLIAVRQMMYLSHSYDHRVVDGALGGAFVRRVADYLENFDINREL